MKRAALTSAGTATMGGSLHSLLADRGSSLPPQEAATGNPENPSAFLGVAQVDLLSPTFAGKSHEWLFPRAAKIKVFNT